MTISREQLDELERRARADASKLDGLHGDPSKLGGWIGHRDHAIAVAMLVPIVRAVLAWRARVTTMTLAANLPQSVWSDLCHLESEMAAALRSTP